MKKFFEIINLIKRNNIIRGTIRSLGYKNRKALNWEEQLSNLKNAIKPNINKKILIAPVVNADQLVISLHSIVGESLKLKGAQVDYLLCDKILPACTNAINFKINYNKFIKEGPATMCNSCYDCGHSLFSDLDKNYLKLSNYISKHEIEKIIKKTTNLSENEIRNFKIDNINIGEHTLAGTLRFFGVGDLSIFENSIGVLRRYFASAMITKLAFERVLNQNKYDCVIVDHGLYVPQGILADVSNKFKIPTKVLWQGYKKNTLLLSDKITYHKSLINEDKRNWIEYDFNENKKKIIKNYLIERNYGKSDWFVFNKNPDNNINKFKEKYEIKKENIVSIMTNVIWDAQLKFDQNIFTSQMDWIIKTIEYLKNKKNIKAFIRVHPAEIRGDVPSNQKIKYEILKKFKILPKNIIIIEPDDNFSSYKLAEISNVIIVYATKLSFELPCFGSNVIVCGEAFGKNKGFTHDPQNQNEYFNLLNQIPFQDKIDDYKINLALKYAYHFFFRRSMEISSLMPDENNYPPFKLRTEFTNNVINKKDKAIETICNSILHNKTAILDD